MEEVSLTINGRKVICRAGTRILDAALENGIQIPTLCHHAHLEPVGACRLCLVQDEKNGRIMASCVTPVSPNMAIQTDSAAVIKHRTNIIRLMIANHPESCILCNQGNRCELRKIAAELGVGSTGLYPMPHYTGLEEANPFIVRDLSKCILCGKCVRADHELVVVGAIDYNLRGFKSRPATAHEMPLEKSNCTFCGTCVSVCPTGALTVKSSRYVGSPETDSRTVCGFCGVGCSLVMGSVGGQMVEVHPSHEHGKVNRSTLCVRGHFAHDFLNASERLSRPLVRKDGELLPATWEQALDIVAERVMNTKKRHGPQSVAFLGSSKCTIEENYLFQKIARVIVGTNSVDNGGYLSGRSVVQRIDERLDGGGRIAPLAELEQAELIFVIGANPTESLPVAGYYLKRAAKMKGVPMLVVDPRRTELVPFSSLWLPLSPNSDSELINALAAILVKRKAHDAHFVSRFAEGFEHYCQGLSSFDLEKASRVTGLDADVLEKAADLLQGKRTAFIVGQGILQQKYGIRSMDALLNLALMTGSLGDWGTGVYFLVKENNPMGAWDMGTVPDSLPGRQSLSNDMNRKFWEQAWRVKLSPDPGLNMIRMIEEAEKGNLKALYIMGENPLRALPQRERVHNALKSLEFLVVQDILFNETTELAHVVLPGAAFAEKGGSFTNLEGRIQTFEPVVFPPGEAKPDWQILDLLSRKMGYPEPHSSLNRVREEISRHVPMYAELGKAGDDDPRIKETSHMRLFNPDREGEMIRFTPVIPMEEEEKDEDYPYEAILGSLKYHLGSGTRTGNSYRIRDFGLRGEVEISPEDGAGLNLRKGDRVRVTSRHGSIFREITLKRDLGPGLIFIPTAFNDNEARQLLNLTTPFGANSSPGWKTIRVKLEKPDA